MKLFRKILKISDVINADKVFVYAAQAAYYVIIASIPTVMLLLSLTKFVLPVSEESLLSSVYPLIPEIIKSPVTRLISELYKGGSFSIVSITAVSAIWSASRGIVAVERGIRNVYHTPPRKSFITNAVSGIIYTLILIPLLIIFIGVVIFGGYIIDFLQVKSGLLHLIFADSSALKWIFTCGVTTVLFAFLYSAFSGRNLRFRCHFPGAVFSSAGWMIFSVLFSFYIENFANYSYIYGSLTAIVLMMLWVYFCSVIFLLGGELNKLCLVNARKNR